MTSKNAQCSTWCIFWILKISCKIGVLKESQSALFSSITHTTILLLVFTCMMNVGDQTSQASVTSSCPLRDRSCKFLHWPQNIRSSNTCQVQAFQNNMRAYFRQLISNVWQYFPHDNTVCIHKYDEYMKSIDSGVCHRLWSILWWIVRAYLLTIEYQVVQVVASRNIKEQVKSILLTILPRISILLLWNDGHQWMELILCRVVESSCLPTHNIVPHISWHDPPCHKTMMKYEDFEGMAVFLFLPRKFSIRTWFCYCPQYLCLFRIDVECSPSTQDPGKMLVLPNQLLYWVLSTSDQCFSFRPIIWLPQTQKRIILFHGVRISSTNWKTLLPTVFQ